MFNKVALLSAILPLVAGLTLQIPQDIVSGGQVTFNWDFQPSDPVFSLFLVNEEFHDSFAIANNIQPTQGSLTITIPVVPIRAGYTLKASNIGNINDVYSETGSFSVAANPSASSVPPVSTTSTTAGSSTRTGTSTTATVPVTKPTTSGTSTGFGVTVSNSASNTVTGSGSATTSPGSANTTNAAGTPVKFAANSNAIAAVVLSAVAGAAYLVL